MSDTRWSVGLAVVLGCACLCGASERTESDGGVAGGGGDGIFEWTSAVSGSYFDQARWTLMSGSGNPPPGEGDRVVFDVSGAYTVTIASGGATETDSMQMNTGNVTFRRSSTTVGATYRLTTGPADAILRGDTFTLGSTSRPVNMVVGDDTILYDNIFMRVTEGSLLLTDSLSLSNVAAVPGYARLELSPGTNIEPSTVTVGGQLTVGQHGTGEIFAYNDSQLTLGGASFICTAISNAQSSGSMLIYDGSDATFENALTVGGHLRSDSPGHLFVSGPGSTITMADDADLTIGGASGSNGQGLVEIVDGSTLTTSTGNMLVRRTGRVEVNFDNSDAMLHVNGPLSVEGGYLHVVRPQMLSLPSGATVNIESDGEMVFTTEPLIVNENRTFNVLGSAELTLFGGGVIGSGTPGTVHVENDDSFLSLAAPLEIGADGAAGTLTLSDSATGFIGPVLYLGLDSTPGSTGIMNIESGANANTADVNVWGMAPGTMSVLTITGFASNMFVTENQLSVGHPDAQGNSVLRMLNTGQLTTSQGDEGDGVTYVWPNGLLYIDPTSRFDSDAELIVDGGELRVSGTLNMLNDSWIEVQSGVVSGDGNIQLSNSFSSLIVSHGTIAPGTSAGRLTFEDATLEMNAGSVTQIELAGLAPGSEYDQIVFDGGDVHLNGTLEVALLDGYTPQSGDEFVIVSATGNVFGTFAEVVTPTPMAVVYDDNLVRLVAETGAPCTGDVVSSDTFEPPPDGVVDGADLAYLLGEWGANPGSLADIVTSTTFEPPPDGVVDGADLAYLLGAWGACE